MKCSVMLLVAFAMTIQTQQAMADDNHASWVDEKRHVAKAFLNKTAHKMDTWFGKTNPNDPARASLRVMMDVHWNDYDGTTIKPRVRAKVKLPTLEDRLSVVFGDDNLDSDHKGGIYNDERTFERGERAFDKKQAKEDNSSLALRWSKLQQNLGVQTDIDLGVRSDDVFVKMRAEKGWQLPHDIHAHFEQMYRYGTKSEHQALSTLAFSQPQSAHRTLINRTQVHYAHKHTEDVNWGNSLYEQHHWQGKHGLREFSYGVYAGGQIQNKKPDLNTYGPYVSYRQPVWREWLFLQGDVSYYNNKSANKDHHLGVFGRAEVVF